MSDRLSRDARVMALMGAFAVAATVLGVVVPDYGPVTLMMVPLLVGSLQIGPRHLPWFVIALLALTVVGVALRGAAVDTRTIVAVTVVFGLGLFVLLVSFRRTRLGVAGLQGESMFVDLRDRILRQARIPRLPEDWYVETALTSAGGTLFAGDFIVAVRPEPGRLEVAIVDVSGKGEQAGTRALLLSGAFGGLLGALPPGEFLAAANDYVLRQGWEEGFATAVHLSVDLTTGAFELRSAGHPPALHRNAGSGRWIELASSGPILGLLPDADYAVAAGTLGHGDAVVLYTDGVVEEHGRDIDLGIDRLLGEAEAELRAQPHGAAQRLVDELGARDDDRTMVLVHRL
ncbi:PP2C family protein-serine/threonine phosphatase [Nocardioides sp.]|uniref:PP2C family protein-serine/threonine phosphatase n=1 Tax=Nocardioides sp. TaxID=35761 RepID=UPI0039E337EE